MIIIIMTIATVNRMGKLDFTVLLFVSLFMVTHF